MSNIPAGVHRMQSLPFISVVIPAYNEEDSLAGCLKALQRQDYEGAFEIIIVNNASTDRTPAIARAMGAQVVDEPRKGYVHAVRAGFAAAKGEIIASTDADTIVPAGWLSKIVQSLQAGPEVVATGGIFKLHGCASWLACMLSLASRLVGHPSGGNMAVRRRAYEAAGGFDPHINLGTDTDLVIRLRRLGRVTFDPRLTVSTSGRRYQFAFWPNIWKYPLNELWLRLFHRPRFYDFADIRGPCKQRLLPRRLAGASVVLAALAFFIYKAELPQSQIFGPVLAIARVDQRVIALTFDDGPGPYTPQVLDILDRYRVQGTFFLIGRNIERHPDIPPLIVAKGNVIGNHSYSHSWWTSVDLPGRIYRELDETAALVQDTARVTTVFFRPPRGLRNPWMIHGVRKKGYTVVTWSIQANDWTNPMPGPEVIAQRVIRQAKPGAIILLHDGLGTRANFQGQNMVAALPVIIETLQAQGYHFVTVPEMLQIQKSTGGAAGKRTLAQGT